MRSKTKEDCSIQGHGSWGWGEANEQRGAHGLWARGDRDVMTTGNVSVLELILYIQCKADSNAKECF